MLRTIIGLIGVFYAVAVCAAPLPEKDVPDPLKPWIGWVLQGEEVNDCPLRYNQLDDAVCSWPATLDISFNADQARFTQQWAVFSADTWIGLPGNANLWPIDVKLNGQPCLEGIRNNTPAVWIKTPGHYTLTGFLHYTRRPEWVQIPSQSGLVGLTVDGREIAFPQLDPDGRLWLKHSRNDADENTRENRCAVQVHRLIRDTIPLDLVTHLDVSISGQQRTIDIGSIGLHNYIPVTIDSPLPLKIEDQGRVMIQAKPGKWQVRITLRHKGPVGKLTPASIGNFNTKTEIWSFEPHNDLRMVDIGGPVQIDPQQTTLPKAWRTYPAYLIRPDSVMTFIEKKRGDPQPPPDMLTLRRLLWLDFDGSGYSVRDHISGRLNTGWRLSVNPPIAPGRIVLNGREQFITRLDESGRAGVEMRYGNVAMTAESRINQTGNIPVTGWDRDFHKVSGEIHLPPGWSIFDASGIDNIKNTWLKSWTLLDLFLVLITALGVAKLISYRWGVVAIITLVLIQHEPGAPCWVWLNILAAIALLKVLPKNKLAAIINNYRLLCIAALILISLPFMVDQIKHGIYPQLEYSWLAMGESSNTYAQHVDAEPKGPRVQTAAPQPPAPAEAKLKKQMRRKSDYVTSGTMWRPKGMITDMNQIDTSAKIQTGAGMPTWHWKKVAFAWNGPVKADETMTFVFLSPRMNMILGFVRVLLLSVLIYGISGIKRSKRRRMDFSNLKPSRLAGIFVIGLLLFAAKPAVAHNAFPNQQLLQQLKQKLTEKVKPDCAPQCAVIPRAKIAIEDDQLTLIMEVHSLYKHVAIPLPGSAKLWLAKTVRLNGEPMSSLYRDPETGTIWASVPHGIHTLRLSGVLPARKTIQIPFPMKINQVTVKATGWKVEGLYDNGVIDNQLQFSRINPSQEKKESFEADLLPPFLEITRIFHLGLTWKIETRVKRVTPVGVAVVRQIPLLAGESVTSDIPVKAGNILLNLGPQQVEAGWVSSLEKAAKLHLKAVDTLEYTEVWKLDISTIWHSEIQGIPAIHHQNQAGRWFPEFRPWPGDELEVTITRPQGVAGQTYTIEKIELKLQPGQRITHADLTLDIRSSRGSRHVIRLPDQSKLQGLMINGKSQPINQAQDKVVLPLVPGEQQIRLSWRTAKAIGFKWNMPPVDVGLPGVNAYITVNMPQNRWILFCSGPYVGPAVLFWSTVLVMFLLALILGRLNITPLKSYHWFLLGLGLTQASVLTILPVALWLIALGLRAKHGKKWSNRVFDLVQLFLPLLTLIAIMVLFFGIRNGLLGYPDMQIAGNGSYDHLLKWYQDISKHILPQPTVFSLPMTVYRVLILGWALWIAFALIRWLRWGWECYSADGLWRKVWLRKTTKSETELDMGQPPIPMQGRGDVEND